MDAIYIERMKYRLANMRKVAELSHDPRIVEIVTETADQLEEDIRKLEAEFPLVPLSSSSRRQEDRQNDAAHVSSPHPGSR